MDRGRMVDSPKLLGQLSKCPPAGGLLELSNPCSGKLLLSQVPVCNAEIQKPRVGQSASERKRLVRSHRGDKSGRKRIGGAEGIRTLDPHVANVVLSQLSYCPTRERVLYSGRHGTANRPFLPFLGASLLRPAPARQQLGRRQAGARFEDR